MSGRVRVFYGWWVVAACGLGLAFSTGSTVVLCFGVYLKPLIEDFHAGRAGVSLGITLHNLTAAACIPLVGALTDRVGARRVIVLGTAVFSAVLISAQWVPPQIAYLYVFYVLIGLVSGSVSPVPYGVVISRWFDKRRGLALGLTMLGLGLGAVTVPMLAHWLIATFGWRVSYAAFGCGALLIALPVFAAVVKDDPKEKGLYPDGVAGAPSTEVNGRDLEGMSWQEIRRERAFWILVGAFFLAGASVHACVFHMSALLTDRGVSPTVGAATTSLMGLSITFGRVGTGYLLDRFFAPRLAMVLFSSGAAGIALLWAGLTGAVAIFGAFLIGMAMGAETDVIAYGISRYFGLRAFGTAYGYGFASFVLAGAVGALVMGAGFDLTHSYTVPLGVLFFAMMGAVLLMSRLGPYRYGVRSAREREVAKVEVSSRV